MKNYCIALSMLFSAGCAHSNPSDHYRSVVDVKKDRVENKNIYLTGYFSFGPYGYTVTSKKYGGECVSIAKTKYSSQPQIIGSYELRTASGYFVRLPNTTGSHDHDACPDDEDWYFVIERLNPMP